MEDEKGFSDDGVNKEDTEELSGEEEDDEENGGGEEEGGEEFEEIYEGQTNTQGKRHGRGTLYFDAKKQDRFEGHFKEGNCCFPLLLTAVIT